MNLAPNGKSSNLTPEQYSLVRTPAFKKWFGDWENDSENASKVVDENGEPLVVYHGTKHLDFNTFDREENMMRTTDWKSGMDIYYHPSFFSENMNYANMFRSRSGFPNKTDNSSGRIIEVFLNIRNPNTSLKEISSHYIHKAIQKNVVLDNSQDGFKGLEQGYNEIVWVSLYPNQIKLADGTNTTFDANNNDIRYANGGGVGDKKKWGAYQNENYNLLGDIFNYKHTAESWANRIYGKEAGFFKEIIVKKEDLINIGKINKELTELGRGGIRKQMYNAEKINKVQIEKSRLLSEINNYNSDVRYADGGNVENKETYKKWKSLVNMSNSELEKFYNSQEGKDAGLSSKEASEQGISSGRESARWVMKMKQTPMAEWTPTMWTWAKKQISFVSRMSGNKGGLYDDKGNKTRKHTSLLIWGHNPEKYEEGANIENKTKTNTIIKQKGSDIRYADGGWIEKPNKIKEDVYKFQDKNGIGYIVKREIGANPNKKWVVSTSIDGEWDGSHKPFNTKKEAINYIESFFDEDGANIENKTKTNTMDKAIEVSTSEYKYSEFYEWFKNYIPSSLYEESWASEMKSLNTLILDNNVEEKITFTDSRLVLISFMALCQSDVTKGGMREWWIIRRYLEQYSDNNSVQGTDLFEFVDKYIGYTFTDANMSEEEKMRIETLKLVLSQHIKDDSIMIPYFVKHEIMSNIKEDVKEEIIEENAPEEEIEQVSVEGKWQGLKDFAEMMMEDAEGEVLEKWQGLYEFCELMLEK